MAYQNSSGLSKRSKKMETSSDKLNVNERPTEEQRREKEEEEETGSRLSFV